MGLHVETVTGTDLMGVETVADGGARTGFTAHVVVAAEVEVAAVAAEMKVHVLQVAGGMQTSCYQGKT